jgi:protein FRG1
MDAYVALKSGKLNLKGEKKSKKSKKHSKKRKLDESAIDIKIDDEKAHGGVWVVDAFDQISGAVSIELQEQMYIHGLDNGLFVLGSEHKYAQPPEPQEILTAIKIDDKFIAFKSGYGKYLSINSAGLLIGRSDAISSKEYFEVEFDYDYDGRKTFIKACNGGYISVNQDGDIVAVVDKKAESALSIRSISKREKKNNSNVPEEEKTEDLRNVEINYVRKFQKFQDKKLRLNAGDVKDLEEAKVTGILHEKLLDRREKMKSDRYCK